MPTQVQYRRGTTEQNDAFTGAIGELTVDTTLKTLRVHDGVTPGGAPLLGQNNTTQPAAFSTLTVSGDAALDAVDITTDLAVGGITYQSISQGVTATGTMQTNAYQITDQVTVFTAVAGGGQGTILPVPAQPGVIIYISNRGDNSLLVYPHVGGTIDNASTNAPITITTNSYWVGVASTTSAWTSIVGTFVPTANQISLTYTAGQPVLSLSNTVVLPGTLTTQTGNLTTFNGSLTAATTSTATFNGSVIVSTSGSLAINATTASTTASNGALVVAGGVGVGGTLNVTGPIYSNGSVVLTSASGGYNGGTITGTVSITNNTVSTNSGTGALVVTGGAGFGSSINILNNATVGGYFIQANRPTLATHVATKEYVDARAVGIAAALS